MKKPCKVGRLKWEVGTDESNCQDMSVFKHVHIEDLATLIAQRLEGMERERLLPESYEKELDRCDKEIEHWRSKGDLYGVNFWQGKQSGIVEGNIIESEAKEELATKLATAEAKVAELLHENDLLKRRNKNQEFVIEEQTRHVEQADANRALVGRLETSIKECVEQLDRMGQEGIRERARAALKEVEAVKSSVQTPPPASASPSEVRTPPLES